MSASSLQQALPALSPGLARLRRVMLDRRMAWCLSGAVGLPVQIEGPGEGPVLDAVLGLHSEAGAVELGLSAGAWPTLRMLLGCGSEPLRQAALAHFMAPLLEALRPGVGSLSPVSLKPGHGYRVQAPLMRAGTVQCSVLALPDGLLERIGQWLASAPVSESAVLRAWAPLRLPVRLTLARTTLALATLAQARAGAWLRATGLDPQNRPRGLRVQAAWGGAGRCVAAAHIDLEEDSVSLVDDFHAGPGDGGDAGAEPAQAGLGGLQVPISFELDTALVSLAELSSMRAGQVLNLDTPLADAPVRLVCHGQVVGVGQLVAVGEQLGVLLQRIGLPT